jgi:glycosyltransferase involved in cell wall biosynthesis
MVAEPKQKSVVLIAHGLSGGGAEMCVLRLAEDISARGYDVAVALLKKKGRLLEFVPPGIRVDEIGGGRISCITRLARYLADRRPDAVISFMTYANVVAVLAQALSPSLKRVVVSEHNAYSHSIKVRGGFSRFIHHAAPLVYRWASSVVCVSEGVAEDFATATRLSRRRMTTIYNPVITDDLIARAREPSGHPWFVDKCRPVIVAVGRLERQKNYPMLLGSFARLRQHLDCRLIILGEGSLEAALRSEAARLGILESVDFAGFRANAPSFMREADLFALSSDFEGLSNVLIEAMAVGCPVVSTDAPHGPREVLEDGRLGRLVPVGDVEAFAGAMEATLRDPGDPEERRRRALAFSVRSSADQYLQVAGLH